MWKVQCNACANVQSLDRPATIYHIYYALLLYMYIAILIIYLYTHVNLILHLIFQTNLSNYICIVFCAYNIIMQISMQIISVITTCILAITDNNKLNCVTIYYQARSQGGFRDARKPHLATKRSQPSKVRDCLYRYALRDSKYATVEFRTARRWLRNASNNGLCARYGSPLTYTSGYATAVGTGDSSFYFFILLLVPIIVSTNTLYSH